MTQREIGLSFRAEIDPARMQRLAATANRYDFATLGVWDDLGDPPPWPLLAALAQVPGNARVGPSCLALPKYPALDGVAGELTRLDRLRPGRVFAGLAGGAWLEQVGLERARAEHMREAVAVLRYLLANRVEGFAGVHYRVTAGFKLHYSTPAEPVPIMIGAWGSQMAAVAAEVADEVKIGGSANPLMASIMRKRLGAGGSGSQRAHDEVAIVLGAVTVVSEDGAAARRLARRRAAVYIDVIGANDPTVRRDYPAELAAIRAAVVAGDIDAAVASLPEGLLRRFAFAGTPGDVIAQAEAAFAAGATRVEFGSPHGFDEVDGIELLGQRVLPYFAAG
jgi:5,10-methylenetetrahydromethanopterin reductase